LEAIPEQFESESKDLIAVGKTLVISTHKEYTQAGQIRRMAMGLMKEADKKFDPLIQAAKEVLEQAKAQKAEIYDPLKFVKDRLGAEIATYERIAEQKRQQDEARAQKEADLKDAEEKRQAAELAQIAEEMGDKELAAEIKGEVAAKPTPIVNIQPTTPVLEAAHHREYWKWKIEDAKALKQAWIEGRIPEEVFIVNEKFVGGKVRDLKTLLGYDGICVYSEKVLIQKA
jgi:hypothetical protein